MKKVEAHKNLLTKFTEIKAKQNRDILIFLYFYITSTLYLGHLRDVALNCVSEQVTPYFSIYFKNLLE